MLDLTPLHPSWYHPPMNDDVIPESPELIEQRVRDLVEHVKDRVPELIGTDGKGALHMKTISMILEELNEEFSEEVHANQLLKYMTSRIAGIVKPQHIAWCEGEAWRIPQDEYLDDEEDIDDVIYRFKVGTIIHWSSLQPVMSDPSLDFLFKTSAVALDHLIIFETYDNFKEFLDLHIRLRSLLSATVNQFMGAMGLTCILYYISIVENHNLPKFDFLNK